MSDIAIRVDGLSKQYRIGGKADPYFTLRDSLSQIAEKVLGMLSRNGPSQAEDRLFWALKDVSLEVKHGEVLGIIGRNGAGKTTLLKILSRITEPTEGRAEIHGRVASLLEVGTGFHLELTGRENIYLSGAILGMKKAEIYRRFDEIVAFAEVEKFIDTPVKRFSTGMYLRLAFAVAAHLNPEILLVDEVLAVGDADFQKKCLGKMQDVAGEGRTVLFVSHNMAAVERLCGRAVLLENGKVSQTGSVQDVTAGYLLSGVRQLGERVWTNPSEAPGDHVVRLRAVRGLDAQGRAANEFEVSEPFCIEVEFWVLSPGYRLDAALYFYNESGTLVFVTGDFQDATWQTRTRPVGIHRSTCHVPGKFLNEGAINILAGVSANPHTLHAIERDAITIRIRDNFQPGGARGNYVRSWPGGVIRPLMTWSFGFQSLDTEETDENEKRKVDV
jgi:lipopolysaccharide transport system ATP-binding protein